MKSHKLAIITISAILFAASATVALSLVITEDAFAKSGRYTGDTNQAASVSNDCLNPLFDSNTIDNVVGVGNCGGTVSQQEESGQASAPITSQTANPTIELQRATTTTQPPLLGDVATGSVRIISEINCSQIGGQIDPCPDELIFGIPIPINNNSIANGSMPIPTGPGESTLFLLTPPPISTSPEDDGTESVDYAQTSISVTNGGCSVQSIDEPPDDPDFQLVVITVPEGDVTCGLDVQYSNPGP